MLKLKEDILTILAVYFIVLVFRILARDGENEIYGVKVHHVKTEQ